jgi:hypothetical protein
LEGASLNAHREQWTRPAPSSDKRPDKQRNHKIRDNARRKMNPSANNTQTATQSDNKRKRAPIATDSKFDRDKQRRKLEAIKHSKTQQQGTKKKMATASS